jgi:hypothetical protein
MQNTSIQHTKAEAEVGWRTLHCSDAPPLPCDATSPHAWWVKRASCVSLESCAGGGGLWRVACRSERCRLPRGCETVGPRAGEGLGSWYQRRERGALGSSGDSSGELASGLLSAPKWHFEFGQRLRARNGAKHVGHMHMHLSRPRPHCRPSPPCFLLLM